MEATGYKTFSLGTKLTDDQIDFFNQNGFIHFSNFMNGEGVAQIIQSMEALQEQGISTGIKHVNGVPVKYGLDENGRQIAHRFPFTNLFSPVIQQLLLDKRLEAIKTLLAGARIAENEQDGIVMNHYVNVPGSTFRHMGWHTDSATDIFYGRKIMPQINAGLYLDDSSAENGGCAFYPEHTNKMFSICFSGNYIF